MPKVNWLTRKQKAFCDKVIETNNLTEAAAQVYNVKNRNTARGIGTENYSKPAIQHYLADKWDLAGSIIEKIMVNEKVNPSTRLDASKYIFDQVHWKATQRILNTNITLNKDIDKMSDEELMKLIHN